MLRDLDRRAHVEVEHRLQRCEIDLAKRLRQRDARIVHDAVDLVGRADAGERRGRPFDIGEIARDQFAGKVDALRMPRETDDAMAAPGKQRAGREADAARRAGNELGAG